MFLIKHDWIRCNSMALIISFKTPLTLDKQQLQIFVVFSVYFRKFLSIFTVVCQSVFLCLSQRMHNVIVRAIEMKNKKKDRKREIAREPENKIYSERKEQLSIQREYIRIRNFQCVCVCVQRNKEYRVQTGNDKKQKGYEKQEHTKRISSSRKAKQRVDHRTHTEECKK